MLKKKPSNDRGSEIVNGQQILSTASCQEHCYVNDTNINIHGDDEIPHNDTIERTHNVTDNACNTALLIVSINVAGLHDKLHEGILDQFLFDFDIVCLSETNTDSPNLVDYH